MLTSRNIHVLLLGVILGAAVAYSYAAFRTQSQRLVLAGEARSRLGTAPTTPEGHPEVTDEDMLAMFQQALATAPDDPELLTRYATFLFDIRRFSDAAETFGRILNHTPANAEVRTYMATALYAAGDRARAVEELETALESDPNQILALHNLALGQLDLNGDVDAAEELLGRIETIDPEYEGLDSLRQRIAAAKLN